MGPESDTEISETFKADRLASLDYLRGLAALGIMSYHFILWTYYTPSSNDFLGKIGIYGVALFYILSGITLYHVYYNKIGNPSKKGLTIFGVSRIFRIFPLLWLLTMATMLLKREPYSATTIFLNLSGLFGLFDRSNTICYGAWSIGNELVFYLFFPLFIYLSKKQKTAFIILTALSCLIFILYSFFLIDSSNPLSATTWIPFINPLNQVFLFLGGYMIAHFTKNLKIPIYHSVFLLIIALLCFIYYPVYGDAINLITGFNRIILTICCFLICFAAYKSTKLFPQPFHFIFGKLGEISYCLYLIHPITAFMYSRVIKFLFSDGQTVSLIWEFIFTIVISYIIYHLFERPFMKLGKRLGQKMAN